MPRSAEETRTRLLDAAERRFASDGIMGATFADIISDAGQRNNSAIQYHFGDRVGLLEAVTARRVEQLSARREELLAGLPDEPTVDQLVEAVVLPLAELLTDPERSAYLQVQAQLLAHPARDELPPMLGEPWSRASMDRLLPMLTDRLPTRSREHAEVRAVLVLTLVFHALADRARTTEPQADHDEFVRALIRATIAILEAPLA